MESDEQFCPAEECAGYGSAVELARGGEPHAGEEAEGDARRSHCLVSRVVATEVPFSLGGVEAGK